MSSRPQGRIQKRYRLKGPYAGKDCVLCGYVFRGGEVEVSVTEREHETLSKAFWFYQAEEVKDDGKRDVSTGETGNVGGEGGPEGAGVEASAPAGGNAGASVAAETGDSGRGLGSGGDGQAEGVGRLRLALLALNPESDEDWTPAGKPSIKAVEKAIRKTVTRAQIEAALPGFTRKGLA